MKNIIDDIKGLDSFNLPPKFVTFFGSARLDEKSKYYLSAKKLAKELGKLGINIASGGGGGIMQAANEGAKESNTESIALNIKLPFEQGINPYANKSFTFKSFSLRKFTLISNAKAFVVFPGGFGTLDELFEILVLIQTGFKNTPVFLYGIEFWTGLDTFILNTLKSNKLIEDKMPYTLTDDLEFIKKEIFKIY